MQLQEVEDFLGKSFTAHQGFLCVVGHYGVGKTVGVTAVCNKFVASHHNSVALASVNGESLCKRHTSSLKILFNVIGDAALVSQKHTADDIEAHLRLKLSPLVILLIDEFD